MITAELMVNPYLRSNTARFHGDAPRIHSKMDRYKDRPLPEWVREIPIIFYDELNGYDFNFYFTGSRSDFEKVQRAFEEHHVGPDQVRLTLKKELESPREKEQQIADLLQWARSSFDHCPSPDSFDEDNIQAPNPVNEIFLLKESWWSGDEPDLSIEWVNHADELKEVELKGIPLVLCTDRQWIESIRQDLAKLLDRDDVKKDQIFFLFAPGSDEVRMTRYLQDLGFPNVQRVDSVADEAIQFYIRDHAQTDKICQSIQELERLTRKLNTFHQQHKDEMIEKKRELSLLIQNYQEQLDLLEEVQQEIQQMKFQTSPELGCEYFDTMVNNIRNWSNRRSKVRKEEEFPILAEKYQEYIHGEIRRFLRKIQELWQQEGQQTEEEILRQLSRCMKDAKENMPSFPADSLAEPDYPNLLNTFKNQFGEEEVEKTDLLNFNPFATMSPRKPEIVTIRYVDLKVWREIAVQAVEPIGQEMIQQVARQLSDFRSEQCQSAFELLNFEINLLCTTLDEHRKLYDFEEKQLMQEEYWMKEWRSRLNRIEEK